MSRISLGDFQITLIREAIYHWDGGAVFGVVPKTLWSRKLAADELNRVAMGFNCYLIQTGANTILVESGAGDKMDERARERMKLPPVSPTLREVIARHGIDPETIDLVLNSHLHWDHCGGNTILCGGTPKPAFPHARYYACRGEWEHAHRRHPRDSISYMDANYDPLIESGRMCLFDGDTEIVPGISMRHAPGHNQDMMVITATSNGETFCFLSDLVPSTAHLHPTWVAAFDLFPLETIDQKFRWLGEAARRNWVCGFGHDAEVPFARVSASGNSFQVSEVLS